MVQFVDVPQGEKAVFLVSEAGDEKEFVASYSGKVDVLTLDEQGKMSDLKDGEHDAVVGVCSVKAYSSRYLELILNVLKPGGLCVLQAPKEANASKSLMFAGFSDISAKSVSDTHEQVSSKKPAWEQGETATVKINLGKEVSAWNLDVDDDDAELEDEDDMLKSDGVDVAAITGSPATC
jgi:hypothetical protein